jgi:mono/diheme cytochrome c family protein
MRSMPLFTKALLGLLVVVVAVPGAAFGYFYVQSEKRLNTTFAVNPPPPQKPAGVDSAALLARGEHLATAVLGCIHCHGANLAGGRPIDEQPVGTIAASNLTTGKGGIGGQLTEVDHVRAVRHGIGRSGRPIPIMPAEDYATLGDADMAALIAYLRSVPPVDNDPGQLNLGPIGRMLMVNDPVFLPAFSIDHDRLLAVDAPATPTATAEYGQYLAKLSGCVSCHKADLKGGEVAPGKPHSADISRERLANWTKDDFIKALRQGVAKDGHKLDPFMPWEAFGHMSDTEVEALWLFLHGG